MPIALGERSLGLITRRGAEESGGHERSFGTIQQMGDNRTNPRPYGSAHDLPSVVEMRRQLAVMKPLMRVMARDRRPQLIEVEKQVKSICDSVDRFYDLLGPRHWIFTEYLPVDDVAAILGPTVSADEAEAGLVGIIADRISGPYWQMGLMGLEPMRARRRNLERAREHYLNEQWDSCALVLVPVMDGFITDVEPASRRGLFARSPEEMVAWDSVVGHHKGLTALMPVFLKSCKRRQDDEVFELYRHGIVHGTVVNYNNQIVATKAWNMLAAVVDWAVATMKAATPSEPKPTLRGTLGLLAKSADDQRYRASFEPWAHSEGEEGFATIDVVQRANEFLGSWQAGRWGLVAEFLPPAAFTKGSTPGRRAAEAKQFYEHTPIVGFNVAHVEFPKAHVAVIRGTASIGEKTGPIEIRWLYVDQNGDLARPGDNRAGWVLAVYPPHTFIEVA